MTTITESLPLDEDKPEDVVNPDLTSAISEDEMIGHELSDSPHVQLSHGQSPNGEDGKGFPERQPLTEEIP